MKLKQGFTLIELLVVIAIIAILAAILFPVFASAREKARQTMCMSDEKQIGLGMLQYTQDNDEKYPMLQYYFNVGGVPNPYDWTSAIYAYIKNGDVSQIGGQPVNYGTGGVWHCPSFPAISNVPQDEYGVNWQLCRNGDGTWAANNLPGFKTVVVGLSQVDAPAEKIMVVEKGASPLAGPGAGFTYASPEIDPTESNFTALGQGPFTNGQPAKAQQDHLELNYDKDCAANATDSVCANWGTSPGDMPRFRHTQTCSTLFVDGHVKSIHRGQMDWGKQIYIPGLYEDLTGSQPN